MNYPPFSWLRLSEDIRKSPSRIWFSFNRLPSEQGSCKVTVHIGDSESSYKDPYDALEGKCQVLPREREVLSMFLKMAKATKAKSEFLLDQASFGTLLPFCSVIPFEVSGSGVITTAKQSARIKSTLKNADTNEVAITFVLLKGASEKLNSTSFFGDINAYVIDDDLKLYQIAPSITKSEAKALLDSSELPLVGLCQKDARDMFYALARLGADFSALNEIAKKPQQAQIYLRLLLNIDDLSKKVCVRAHLVTLISNDDFSDEVEIKSTGVIPTIHIQAHDDMNEEKFTEEISAPTLLKRPSQDEQKARNFLFQLDASPARLHDGFEIVGEKAINFLKAISQTRELPANIMLDEAARPEIINLDKKPILTVQAANDEPNRIEVALSLSDEYDATKTPFSHIFKAKDNFLVLDEDNLLCINDDIKAIINYISESLGLEEPLVYKSKPVAQVALLLNSFSDKIEVRGDEKLIDFLKNFSIEEQEADRILPTDLLPSLRPYQHDAVAWLSSLRRSGLGGLLGDEMGLGKTLMILTHLAKIKEFNNITHPAIVICPTSVIDVWSEEAKKHIPSLKILKWHGADRLSLLDSFGDVDIIITSYAILRRDFDSILGKLKFSTMVLDEAQYIRNQQTDSFKAAKSINCDHKIALTGTPIENHLSDLYNILECVEEGILGSRSRFESQFVAPIEAGLTHKAANLKVLLSPIITRRRKSEVESELPEKIENIVHCKLSPDQKELYKEYVSQMSSSFNPNQKATANTHFTLLSALTRLRQICCHPSLILGDEAKDKESGKLTALRGIMKECLEMGRKIIIYSQFLKMQEHIVKIAKELDDQGALWLHGSSQNRNEIVQGFQRDDGPKMIVVSLKAGGTGITLTQADTVIFADPWWNPAVEDQAVDRAHRIGQKKTVHVIRLIAEDSIEGEVVTLAQKKRLSAQAIMDGGFKTAANLSKDEVQVLLMREIERLGPNNDEDIED